MCEEISTKLENTAASHLIIYRDVQTKLGGTEGTLSTSGGRRGMHTQFGTENLKE